MTMWRRSHGHCRARSDRSGGKRGWPWLWRPQPLGPGHGGHRRGVRAPGPPSAGTGRHVYRHGPVLWDRGNSGARARGQRDEVVVSTKAHPHGAGGQPLTPRDCADSVQLSLRRLRTDRVDVFHLHGVDVGLYQHCVGELVPELQRLRCRGGAAVPGHIRSASVQTPGTPCCSAPFSTTAGT